MAQEGAASQSLEIFSEHILLNTVLILSVVQVRAVSSLELMLVGLMVILPSLVYGLILLKLPGLKYKMPSASQSGL